MLEQQQRQMTANDDTGATTAVNNSKLGPVVVSNFGKLTVLEQQKRQMMMTGATQVHNSEAVMVGKFGKLPPKLPLGKLASRSSSLESSLHKNRSRIVSFTSDSSDAADRKTKETKGASVPHNNVNNNNTSFYSERGITYEDEIYERNTITTEEFIALRNDLDGPSLLCCPKNTTKATVRDSVVSTSTATTCATSNSSTMSCNKDSTASAENDQDESELNSQERAVDGSNNNDIENDNDIDNNVVDDFNTTGNRIETPSLRYKSIMMMEDAIRKIPYSQKQAYMEARKLSPSEVLWRSGYRLRFLRFENFDATKAAKRYVKYWEMRKEIFGSYDFFKPMKLPTTTAGGSGSGSSCLSDQDVEHLSWGHTFVLPKRDKFGRQILYHDKSLVNLDRWNPDSLLRCQVYVLHTIMENENKITTGTHNHYNIANNERQQQQQQQQLQQQGNNNIISFVSIVNLTNTPRELYTQRQIKLYNVFLRECIPIRRALCHIINPSAYEQLLIGPVLKKYVGREGRFRLLIHKGDCFSNDIINLLKEYGLGSNDNDNNGDDNNKIIKDNIPIHIGGTYKHNPIQWIDKQRRNEIPYTIKYWMLKNSISLTTTR